MYTCGGGAGDARVHVKKNRVHARIRPDSTGVGQAGCTFFETQESYEISRAPGETFNAPRSGVVGPRLSLI